MTHKLPYTKAVNNAARLGTSPGPAVVQENLNTMRRVVANIGTKIAQGGEPAHDFEEIQRALKAVPLSTGEFGVARNHLNNAIQYLQELEQGAALFELRMLMGLVAHLEEEADSSRRLTTAGS